MRALVAEMQRRAFELAQAAFAAEPAPGPEHEIDPPAAGRLGEIRCPALVVLGALDVPDVRAIGVHLGAGIPDVRLEAPAVIDELVTPFLDTRLA